MTATLYGMKHSHPVLCSRLALEATGIDHKVRHILPGMHGLYVRARGFDGWHVPALALEGRRIQGTIAIAQELHRHYPDAGIYPKDPAARAAVEAAERWGHDELQPIARRVFRWAGLRHNAVREWMAREVVGFPAPKLAGQAFVPVMHLFAIRISGADDEQVREDLARLPGLLDEADRLVEQGVIGGEPPNAADFQIGASLRLLMAHEDLRPIIEPHPCGQVTLRLLPDYPRPHEALAPVPAVLPKEWLPQPVAG